MIGTARYASINALNGVSQSRRDDLEAIGYVLMYFLRGRLPWQGIPVKNKEERYRKIMQKKIETSAEELCQNFPEEFMNYVNYTRNLEYEQDPDYGFLKNLFVNVLRKDGYIIDCYYDWDRATITYFRDFENFKSKKEKNDKNINIVLKNKKNEISTLNDIQSNVNNFNNLPTVNTEENTMNANTNIINNNNINIKSINNGYQFSSKMNKFHVNNYIKNNNLTSNISVKKNANVSAFNPTNYEGSNQKINETIQNQPNTKVNKENIDNNNMDYQKSNYIDNNAENNVIREANNIDNNNNGQNNNQKNIRTNKDNCCCLIF